MEQINSTISIINNRYQVQKTLGYGGMAIVYLAQDLMLERLVAIKVLREDYSGDPSFRERFRLEAKRQPTFLILTLSPCMILASMGSVYTW